MSNTKSIEYTSVAIVLHKTYIRYGKYTFDDPTHNGREVALSIYKCDKFGIQFNENKPRILADKNELMLSTEYKLKCIVEINKNVLLFPTKKNNRDWSRSLEGRRFLEDIFLDHLNYFINNILYLSDKGNPWHHLLRSVRPIGTDDIIVISFHLDNKLVAAQGNPLFRFMSTRNKDEAFWPKSSKISNSFYNFPSESKLLLRASVLVNTGFYQEAILIAFSVLDAKVQELFEDRMYQERSMEKKETKKYMRNISQDRMNTVINFLLRALDNASLKEKESKLFSNLDKLNSKRNRIIHNSENATREESKNAVLLVAKILAFFNKMHKSKFDIPDCLLNDEKSWLWF